MHTSGPNETRRTFIRKSVLAVGVMSGADWSIAQRASAAEIGPQYDYPWNVQVGRARVFLYLLRGIPVSDILFNDSLYSLLNHMYNEAVLAQGTYYGKRIDQVITSGPNPSSYQELLTGLNAAMTAVGNSTHSDKTLEWYAITSHNAWNTAYNAMAGLDGIVPISFRNFSETAANNQRAAAQGFLGTITNGRPNRDWMATDYKDRTLDHLFTLQRNHPSISAHERATWWMARDRGLIWCFPRRHAVTSERISPPDDVHVLVENDKQCINNVCEPNHPNEYCQQVDGVCNTMST